MKPFAKLVVLLVMAAVGASSLAAQPLLLQAQPQERPAGCHQHGSNAPAPLSKSYQCCLTGHNTAIPQTFLSLEPMHNMQVELLIDSPIGSLATSGLGKLTVSSGNPPGATPLRI
jgi:hypothetical protein